jgi:hypothetical protein
MTFLSKIFNKIFEAAETYSRYKTAALLASNVKSREELEQILNDLYGPKK